MWYSCESSNSDRLQIAKLQAHTFTVYKETFAYVLPINQIILRRYNSALPYLGTLPENHKTQTVPLQETYIKSVE